MQEDKYKLCFIISHKYYRNYESYIEYYIENIQKLYPNSLCIIVDNNSTYIEDIIKRLSRFKNTVILTNVSLCKFELGAYKTGIYYLLQQNILKNYDYIIFSQDTFVLKNKFDFNIMKNNNIYGMSFGCGPSGSYLCGLDSDHSQEVLKRVNLSNNKNELTVCWACSFILNESKILEFLDITKNILITNRVESEYSERYFDAILYYFNGNKRFSMNDISKLSYDCWKINIIEDDVIEYFAKRVQQKTEKTVDL
jgi:hypothetical protein